MRERTDNLADQQHPDGLRRKPVRGNGLPRDDIPSQVGFLVEQACQECQRIFEYSSHTESGSGCSLDEWEYAFVAETHGQKHLSRKTRLGC